MRKIFQILLFAILSAEASGALERVEALHPKRLLELLPKAEDGWKIEVSRGFQEFAENPNVITIATRRYVYTFPSEFRAKPGDISPPPPLRVEMRILDSALTPGETSVIEKLYGKGKEEWTFAEDEKWKTVAGEPMVIYKAEGVYHLLIGIMNRFLIAVDLYEFDDKQVEGWIKRMDVGGIRRAVDAERVVPIKLTDGRRFDLHRYDELNPKRNFTNPFYFEAWRYERILKKTKKSEK